LKAAGIRVEVDASDDRMQKKVRNAQMQKVPYMLIAGEEDMNSGAVSFRYRNGDQKNGIPIAQAIEEILQTISTRKQV
jgi:threonyl-tRNA synthetase